MKSALNMSHPKICRVKNRWRVQSECSPPKPWAAVLSVAQRSVVVRAVSLHVDPTDALPKLRASGRLLLFAVGAAVCVAAARGLQQGVVRQRQGLVKQGVQSLLVDPGFRKLHLREEQVADQRVARCQRDFFMLIKQHLGRWATCRKVSVPLPWSASSLWRTRWRCSRPRPACGLGRRTTSSRSHRRSRL